MKAPTTLIELQSQIYKETRHAARPVPQLMTWLLERRNLEAAWDRVRAADGANTPGLDGVTAREIEARAIPWLAKLCDDLYHGRYQPAPVRWVDVRKQPGRTATRRLGILTLRDRVVHAALKQVLEPIFEPGFHGQSFGFRPGRSVPGALAEAVRLLSGTAAEAQPFQAAVPLDVAGCFDSIDHQILMEILARQVADAGVLALLEQLMAAGGTTVTRWWRKRVRGVIQGSSLSPLLCNCYLHPLDDALAALGLATQNGVLALRYADDLLVLARDNVLARKALACARQTLGLLRQRLRDEKGPVCSLREGVPWLGVLIHPRPAYWRGKARFGYVIPDAKVRAMLDRVEEITTPPCARIDARAFDLGRWLVSINTQLREWRQAYLFADNAGVVFRALDEHALERVGLLLQSVLGKSRYALWAEYRLRLPRGFWTWQVNGCRLVILSALAPHAPEKLTRKPAWQARQPGAPRPAVPPRPFSPSPETFRAGPPQGANPPVSSPDGESAIATEGGD